MPPSAELTLDRRIQVMRIILVALMGGVGALMVIAVVMRTGGQFGPPRENPVITYVSFAYAAGIFAAHAFVPNRVAAGVRRRLAGDVAPSAPDDTGLSPDEKSLCAAYQTRLIVAAALVEGAAFMFLIAYMIEGNWISLAAGVACLVLLAAKFPTENGVRRWMEAQQELLAAERDRA